MPESIDILKTEIKYLKGVGPVRAALLLKELNMRYFKDLLYHFPFRYIDRTKFFNIKEIEPNNTAVQLKGKIIKIETLGSAKSQRFTAILEDESGQIELVWFKGIKWIKEKIALQQHYIVFGKPSIFGTKLNLLHPEIEKLDNSVELSSKLQAVYSTSESLSNAGLNSHGFNKIITNLIPLVEAHLRENLCPELIQKYGFISHQQAMRNIHLPENYSQIQSAQNRLKYEEFLFIQLQLIQLNIIRKEQVDGYTFAKVGKYFNDFFHQNLPFELTDAQKKVIKEIRSDFVLGKQMNRLLQGDVGSGKTLVSLMCMLIVADNGYQSALMAPTEILAQQHFNTISKFLDGIPINIGLLTGSTPAPERKDLLEKLQNGTLKILVGTHALIEPKIQFQQLGFVVIDEQHRFGVEQRAKLRAKGAQIPHVLVMTATPIPRTMAMTLYGDLDYSIIDELPPGRKSIKTVHYFDSKRMEVVTFMRQQITLGRQIYVVFPLINESETLDLKDLQEGYDNISQLFPIPDYQISVVHGQMKAKDKEFEMDRFKRKITQIMVATTVIEVGVDVPNASVMIIENAERFGLSQLHQLRGRVGRGADQSYCILMSSYKLSKEAEKRLQTMVDTNDGFEIAEVDLKLRGPGDMQGTQQSGILNLHIADIVKDEKILQLARKDAKQILSIDPQLKSAENQPIARFLDQLKREKNNWGLIG
jgi:ATP-dependent DNA helicase RecG